MSEREPGSRIRRADPTLHDRRSPDSLRPFGLPRAIGVLLYGVFSALLVIPLIRRLRRRPVWNFVRIGAALVAVALLFFGQSWAYVIAAVLAASAMLLNRTKDPDLERRLQKRHGAEYLLNGGEWAGELSLPGLEHGAPVYLLLKGKHLLIVPRADAAGSGEEVRHAHRVDRLSEILVDGARYVPVYVSEAKQPPVREREVNRHQTSIVELIDENGHSLRFIHRGAFSRHLAETAAHAIYSVRERVRGGGGESLFEIHTGSAGGS